MPPKTPGCPDLIRVAGVNRITSEPRALANKGYDHTKQQKAETLLVGIAPPGNITTSTTVHRAEGRAAQGRAGQERQGAGKAK